MAEAHLNRCKYLEDSLSAFIGLTPELALKQARVAEREIAYGSGRGPLHGIPLALKE